MAQRYRSLFSPSRPEFESRHSQNFLTIEISSAVIKREKKVLLRQCMALEPQKNKYLFSYIKWLLFAL